MAVILKNWVYFYIMRSNCYIGKKTINFARFAQLRKLRDHIKYMTVYIELNCELTVAEVHPNSKFAIARVKCYPKLSWQFTNKDIKYVRLSVTDEKTNGILLIYKKKITLALQASWILWNWVITILFYSSQFTLRDPFIFKDYQKTQVIMWTEDIKKSCLFLISYIIQNCCHNNLMSCQMFSTTALCFNTASISLLLLNPPSLPLSAFSHFLPNNFGQEYLCVHRLARCWMWAKLTWISQVYVADLPQAEDWGEKWWEKLISSSTELLLFMKLVKQTNYGEASK